MPMTPSGKIAKDDLAKIADELKERENFRKGKKLNLAATGPLMKGH